MSLLGRAFVSFGHIAIIGICFAYSVNEFVVKTAVASDLTVKVSQEGKVISGAVVCVGSRQEPALFGTATTNDEGVALFSDLPDGSLFATALKDGKSGQVARQNFVVRWVFVELSADSESGVSSKLNCDVGN